MRATITETALDNTLRLITIPMDTPSVSALVLIGAGSRYESSQEAGLSHFLEHMMFKGTKKRPTNMEIVQEVDGLGGSYNAYTSRDHTGYYIKAAATHLPKLLDILSDMTLNSVLKQEEIDREKGVIIQEMMMYEDTPMRRVEEEFESLLYGATSKLGQPIIGSKETVSRFNRDDFVSYMERLYRPSNAVVVLAGGVPRDAVSLVEESFKKWHNSKTPAYEPQQQTDRKDRVNLIHKETEQTHLCIGTFGYSRTDDRRYALSLLMAMLGGGMSSRLFHQVRERRGLAYYVRSWVNKYQDGGNVVTQAGVDRQKLEEAVKVIVHEFQKISETGYKVPDTELKKAKEFIKGHIILSMEDSMNVAQYAGNGALLDGQTRTLKQTLDAIDKVTLDDIVAVSHDVLIENKLYLAVIGPNVTKSRSKLDTYLN